MLTVLVGAAAPARAATITFADVMRSVGADGQLRPASEVHMRLGGQSAVAQSGTSPSQQQLSDAGQQTAQQGSAATSTTAPASSEATLSQSGGNVQTVDLGDVTGTVCDCGEIPRVAIPKGGFPWWTLLGIPVICVSGICTPNHNNTPECVETPCTTPTPPPTPTPEPLTLLLFGSGLVALGARGRRRRGTKHIEEVVLTPAAEEV